MALSLQALRIAARRRVALTAALAWQAAESVTVFGVGLGLAAGRLLALRCWSAWAAHARRRLTWRVFLSRHCARVHAHALAFAAWRQRMRMGVSPGVAPPGFLAGRPPDDGWQLRRVPAPAPKPQTPGSASADAGLTPRLKGTPAQRVRLVLHMDATAGGESLLRQCGHRKHACPVCQRWLPIP